MASKSIPTSKNALPNWINRLAEGRLGLAVLSAMEATFLPIPLEAVLVPIMVSRPAHAVRIGLWALLGCLVGSMILYGLGLLAQPLVDQLLGQLNLTDAFDQMKDRLSGGSLFLTVSLISLSPAPLQLASLGSGVVAANPIVFLLAVTASRGVRYLGLGVLAKWLGPKLQDIEIPFWAYCVLGLMLVAIGFLFF